LRSGLILVTKTEQERPWREILERQTALNVVQAQKTFVVDRTLFCAICGRATPFPPGSTRGTSFKQETHKFWTDFSCSNFRKE
jgi:hypothetical protein